MREENKLQGNGAWFNARTGKLTASRIKSAMKYLKDGKDAADRRNLKIEIICERLTGDIVDKFVSQAMQWGIEKEPEAKEVYEQKTGRVIKDMGFVDHPKIEFCGASPDGLVDDGLVEIKCPATTTFLYWIFAGVVPEEHKPQMALQCACTGRPWVDFVAYDPRMPEAQRLFVRRYTPTAEEIAEVEAEAVKFLQEVEEMFEQLTKVEML